MAAPVVAAQGPPRTAPGPKRDAILRAAIDVFAERGYFNAQVADVAPRRRCRRRHRLPLLPQQGRPPDLDLRARHARGADRGARPRWPWSATRANGSAASHDCTWPVSAATAIWPWSFRSSSGNPPSSWSVFLDAAARLPRPHCAPRSPTASATACCAPTSSRPWPRRCCSARSTRWPPTGFSVAGAIQLEADADAVVDLFLNGARAR